MIRSMTAYASAEALTPAGALTCELRAVNHRYLELAPRLPDDMRVFESALRERMMSRLSRGKVDVIVRRGESRGDSLQIDGVLVSRLSELALDMEARFPHMRVEFTELLRFPGVLQHAEADQDTQQAALLDVLDRALDVLTATREREGAKLADILRERLDAIERIVTEVRGWMPEIRTALRARLEGRQDRVPGPPRRRSDAAAGRRRRGDGDGEDPRRARALSATTGEHGGIHLPVGHRAPRADHGSARQHPAVHHGDAGRAARAAREADPA